MHHGRQQRGFALIATISVMVLLVMIALAMLSLATLETRGAKTGVAHTEAQANARMALMMAIAQLQREAGNDDRATAPSGQLTSGTGSGENAHWTGVYRVRKDGETKAVVDRHLSPDYLTDLRSADENHIKNELFLSWLVSQVPGTTLDPSAPLAAADSVELVGLGSSSDSRTVAAPLVKIEEGSKKGAYAYWVGDESTKARMDLQPGHDMPAVADADYQKLLRRASKTDLSINAKYTGYDQVDNDHWWKIITYNEATQTKLAGTPQAARDALRETYFALTPYHEGLLTNAVQSGFKKDLSAFLNQPMSRTGITASDTSRRDGIMGTHPIIRGARHAKTSPQYDTLRRYQLMRHLVQENAGTAGAKAIIQLTDKLPGDSDFSLIASQRDLGDYQRTEMGGTLPDITSLDRPNIQPVLAEASLGFDFSCFETSASTASNKTYSLRCHLYPTAKLWNPYNVAMKTPPYVVLIGCMMDAHAGNAWSSGAQICHFTAGGGGGNDGAFISFFGAHDANYNNPHVPDNGKVRRYFGFTLPSVTIQPGETLVFSPDWQKGSGKISSPGSRGTALYDFDFSKNILSPKATPGEGSYYFEFKNQIARKDSTYGFNGDLWLPERGTGDQVMLKAVTDGRLSGLTYQEIALNAGSAKKYPTVAYINPNPSGLYYDMNRIKHTTYFTLALGEMGSYQNAAKANGVANGLGGGKLLKEFDKVDIGPPPRFWRYGNRLIYYDEMGGNGMMSGFNYGPDGGNYSNFAIANSWNPRAPMSHSGWATQNSTWGWWSTGIHHRPFVFPLMNGSEGDAPYLSSEGNYIANPLSMAEGRATEPDAETAVVLYHLPRKSSPMMSLADLRHAQLSLHPWHPNYVIGHGFADGRSASDATISTADKANQVFGKTLLTPENDRRWKDNTLWQDQNRRNGTASWGWLIQDSEVASNGPAEISRDPGFSSGTHTQDDEILVYDIAYEANHELWDRFFISGIDYSETGAPIWDPSKSLLTGGIRASSVTARATEKLDDGLTGSDAVSFAYHKSAQYLSNKGAFNVNSTSVEAWRYMLSSLRNLQRKAADGNVAPTSGSSPFSGIHFPGIATGDKANSNSAEQIFSGYRALSDAEIETLAEEIVKQVRLRGPFLSLSDFINRRLLDINVSSRPSLSSKEGSAVMSAMEAAIELSGINDSLHTKKGNEKDTTDDALPTQQFKHWGDQRLAPEWKASGMPGYLSQGAILSAIGSSLTTRGDTFVIRAYGESRAADDTVLARAWCEAVVQRIPDYINSSDDPMEPLLVSASTDPSSSELEFNTKISESSREYGRRFVIKHFRWLNENEI
ncbi:hypothetical protein NT6N_21400 [Oceaniferula spumae]|uniref:Verru_Chthon cassette protein A n=1 Tax=Oceaniferula spumae TaxID=2979115 RepID=A0AAT9FMB0_9BACT